MSLFVCVRIHCADHPIPTVSKQAGLVYQQTGQAGELLKRAKVLGFLIAIKLSFPKAPRLPPRDYSGVPQYAAMGVSQSSDPHQKVHPHFQDQVSKVHKSLEHLDVSCSGRTMGYGFRSIVQMSAIAPGDLVIKRIFVTVGSSEWYFRTKVSWSFFSEHVLTPLQSASSHRNTARARQRVSLLSLDYQTANAQRYQPGNLWIYRTLPRHYPTTMERAADHLHAQISQSRMYESSVYKADARQIDSRNSLTRA